MQHRQLLFALLILCPPASDAEEVLFKAEPFTAAGLFTDGIEGPAVDENGNIYCVKFGGEHTLGKVTPEGRAELFVNLPEGSTANGIRFGLDGRLLVADYTGHNVLQVDPATKEIRVFAHEPKMNQPNDLAITEEGILYASDPNWKEGWGQIWRIDPAGRVRKVAADLGTTNGIDISPDGRTLYVNESVQRNVWAFTIEPDGGLTDKRLVRQFPDFGFDGMRLDVEGNLYITRHGKGSVVKLSPAGEILEEIELPGSKPSNLCFGGPDGRTVYVTEMEHGRLVSFRVDKPGLEWQRTRRRVTMTEVAETEHFFYRRAPDGPYIDSQRGSRAFGFGGGKIYLSEDNARTWAHSADFPEADHVTWSCLLENGNVLFATRERLFLSTNNLKTHREIIVKNRDGSDYRPHQPVNPDQPGWYFHTLDGEHCFKVGGREMVVWGNYCNVVGGPVPVNIYYSTDNGETVKIAYSFGQNPHFQQKGAPPEAPLLGDAGNPVIARHIHNVTYNPAENAFYACTGDIDRGHGKEVHWLRGTYDAAADAWDWRILISVDSNSRFKSGGINFLDGKVFWIADANGPKFGPLHDRGVFMCDPKDLTDKSKHTLLFNPGFESANMLIEDGVIIATHCAPASTYANGIIYSPDGGRTWVQYDLKEFGPRSGCRIHRKNSDGWFRLDLRKGWIDRAEVMFIKPKA